MEEDSDNQLRDQKLVLKNVHARLEPVVQIYKQSITSIWVANGAAALAMLSFIGSALKDGKFLRISLIPLILFVSGLISMGYGVWRYLKEEQKIIHQMELSNSILQFLADESLSPTEKAGLTSKNWITRMEIVSAVCFIFGCVSGILELLFL